MNNYWVGDECQIHARFVVNRQGFVDRVMESCIGQIVFCRGLRLFLLLVSLQTCLAQTNLIVLENQLAGNPSSQWDVIGDGDASIQGYATQMSVNKGQVVRFKVKTTANNYRLDIYRLGYYAGLGARFVVTVNPSVSLPQTQPSPITDPATGLIDCGNWAQSATWQVPTNATSGVYIAKLVRPDTGGASHIIFVVRDDDGGSKLLFQTSDTTWQAYNYYGGNSLYTGNPAGRAYKVSYNRPINNRGGTFWDSIFIAEYPMIRWLERNGYDVSYTTGVDTETRGSLLLQHQIFLSVGHDEYWSAGQRSNVEAARNAGVNLAFFSGNEIFWKTRWENAIDGSGTTNRTLVCYKETHAGAKIDPNTAWTGTWRDPRFSPPSDGGRPENALSGTMFVVNGITLNTLEVPAEYGAHRFWRNTSVATLGAGQVAVFGSGTLGFEWDVTPDNGFQPPGQMKLSQTTAGGLSILQDYGSTYATGSATHNLSLYRHSSGALVFGAGTIGWSWGLDNMHDKGSAVADARLQQATVNLFADMGVQPGTLQTNLLPTTSSTDATRPMSVINSPSSGSSVPPGFPLIISGTASDTGGLVWGVEVSTDGGTNWHPAAGKGAWSYAWTPVTTGAYTIKTRAVDDSGNLEIPSTGINVTVTAGQTIGNPTEGLLLEEVGPHWINAGRFQASNNLTVTTMVAKVAGISGRYKCAIYSDNGGLPSRLLRSTTELTNVSTGWRSFPLTATQTLTNGQFYWLAIWSDAGSAAIYYSNTAGTIRWGNTNYGVWPDPVGTSGGASLNFSIYAVGTASPLTNIILTPTNPTNIVGETRQFTAIGNYSNGSTQDISDQATWISSNASVATVSGNGTATAVAAGNATIVAAMGNVSVGTTLTVLQGPLVITTGSLPGGTVNSSYGATLSATGGTQPYNWTLASGSLPVGLTLNSNSGAITGNPTANGSYNFTARVSDASGPVQTVSNAFSIVVTTPPVITNIGNTNEGALIDTVGAAWINAGWFQASDNLTVTTMVAKVVGIIGRYKCAIYSDNGGQPNQLLRTSVELTNASTGWQNFALAASLGLTNGQYYWLAIWSDASGAAIYYSNTAGSVRWGNANYGVWPDPVATSGGANLNFCIYAMGAAVPAAPTATNMMVSMLEDTSTNLTLLGGGGTISYGILNNPTNGVLSGFNTNSGAVSYTPNMNYYGVDTFRYVVSDGSLQATGTVSITILEVNDAPVFVGSPTNRVINELTLMTVTNNATDSDLPANVLTYQLINAPSGAVIDVNGVITWTPGEVQGPGTNTITTVVNDGLVSVTNSFVVTVLEVNVPPVFVGSPTNRVINELTLMTVTNNATDSDLPANVLTYQLINAPSGVVIDVNGVITWTPSEAQGSSTNTITTVVIDNGVPSLSATNSFVVTVLEVNVAPVFVGTPTNRVINELTLLMVTNNATDSDLPANVLTYQLINAPSGAVIDVNGVITWTPSEAQGPGTNTITTVVNDGLISITNSFVVTVLEVNVAPVFVGTPTNRVINELTLLTVTNNATDSDLPANVLTYQLINAPSGAVIDVNGVITWTPSEAQGPGTNTITTVVNDGLISITNSFVVTVLEVNVAPVFVGTPTNRVINELMLLTVTNNATDSDLPANILTYSLVNAPSGAVIDANGVITWTPSEVQGPGTNTITTVVTDNGVPSLSATNSFVVTVLEVNVAPVANDDNYNLGDGAVLTVSNPGVLSNDSDADGDDLMAILVSGTLQGVLNLNPDGGFHYTPTNHFSGVDKFTYQVSDGQSNSAPAMVSIVVSNNIQIMSIGLSNGEVVMAWSAINGKSYRLEYKVNLDDPNWMEVSPEVVATGPTATVTNATPISNRRFYRISCPQN